MTTKNLFLRIFFYSILVVSSIHFINIKAMIESRFNNPFAFENFSARAADDLLPVEFIKYKDPSVADKVTILSNGMINIKGISELSYAGVPKELPTYTFSEQKEGFYGKNIGYFRFNIISPYPEAESVVYVINNDKQFTYNLVDRAFEIDHPLAQKKDGVNWTPIDWGTQNLLMKFIDKDGNELGIKTLVISNSSLKQQKPTNFIAADINPGMLFPLEILNPTILDGSINFGDIVLKTDGTTDNKDLILSKEQMIGLSTNRYFDFSLKLNQAYSSLKFFINGQELQVNNDVFLINSEKEKINVYFAVAKEDFSKNFSPYYEGAQNFNLVVRLIDEKNSIIGEQEVNFSFNIIKESNALAKEFISVKDPKELSNFAEISNGLIVIKNLGELDYNGTFSNLLNFSFNNQAMGQLGEDIGYFTAIISNPYPEAMTASWTIDGGKVFYHDFSSSGSSISVDFALASRGDKINWTPLENNSQKLLIQFFDSEGGLVGEKEVNVLFEDIKQKQPSNVISSYISSQLIPYTLTKIYDGRMEVSDIILNKDGSTNYKELNLSKEQGVGDHQFRYLDTSFNLTDEEASDVASLSFLINGSPYNPNSKDFVIQYDQENKLIKFYFAVAQLDDSKQFIPYYNQVLKDFSLITRIKDSSGLIIMEKIISTSFSLSDGSSHSDIKAFPAKQFLFNNEALVSSNGQIGFNSNTFFYQQEKGDYLVDSQLNNKYLFPKDLEYMKELSPSCRYIRFTLSLNSEKPKLNSLKYDVGGKDYDYNFLDQNNNSVYVFNRNQEIDFYYPVTCYLKGETGNYWKNNPINSKWKINYLDELSKNNYQYYFNVNLNLSGVCKKNNELISLPIEIFSFDDEYLNKYSQKKIGVLYFNYLINSEIQKKYINQNISSFSGLKNLRYFKINFNLDNSKEKEPVIIGDEKLKYDGATEYDQKTDVMSGEKSTIIGDEKLKYDGATEYDQKANVVSEKESAIIGDEKLKTDVVSEINEKIDVIDKTETNRIAYINIEDSDKYRNFIIKGNSLYIPAFSYSSGKLVSYPVDQSIILNFVDSYCNIFPAKFQIISKPILQYKDNPSTPVVETKPIEPEYKEVYNPVTGELIREKINPEKENLTTPSKEAAKVVDAKLLTEAQMVHKSPKEEIKTLLLRSVNVEKSDSELEKKVEVKHQSLFVGASTPEVKTSLKNYLAYGTESTVRLGEGQRAATVINYTSVKGNIPQTESDIEDVLKIANNRVPLIRNSELEPKFLGNFYRLNNIIKENDITKIDEDNFILELNQFLRFSYGILPMERSIAKEKWAIELFVKNYNKLPQTDGEWRIVNSWAYRNVLISQVENNLDWINSVASENSEITVELLDKFFELAVK